MQNVTIKAVGNKLTIECDLSQKGTLSATGKSLVIASTHGNQQVTAGDKIVTVGLNVYTKAR